MRTVDDLKLDIQDGQTLDRWHRLSFSESKDERLTKGDFHGEVRHLRFRARLSKEDYEAEPPSMLIVYLDDDIKNWDDKFEIPLDDSEHVGEGAYVYRSAPELRNGSGRTPAKNFRNRFWAVGKAYVTVCNEDKTPLVDSEERRYQTRISLDYERAEYQETYEQIRNDVQREGSAIDVGSRVRDELLASKEGGKESPLLSLYYRLKDLLPKIEEHLDAIVAAPSTQISLTTRHFSFASGSAGRAISAAGADRNSMSVLRSARGAKGPVPTQFMARVPERTTDIPANRFARTALEQVLYWLRDIDVQVETYIERLQERLDDMKAEGQGTPYDIWGRPGRHLWNWDPDKYTGTGPPQKENCQKKTLWDTKDETSIHVKETFGEVVEHQNIHRELKTARERLDGLRHAFPMTNREATAPADTATLALDPRYAQLRGKVQEFAAALYTPDVPGADKLVETPVGSFSKLVELWVFQRTVNALDLLGFDSQGPTEAGYDSFDLNRVPGHETEYRHRDRLPEGARISLCYEKIYPRFSVAKKLKTGHLYGVEDRKDRQTTCRNKAAPDVVIEYFAPGKDVPKVLVLDPSLPSSDYGVDDAVKEKSIYLETIRSFHETEDTGAWEPKSKSIVMASYCVTPEWKGHDLYDSSEYEPDSHLRHPMGLLSLPSQKERAAERIAKAIENVFCKESIWQSEDKPH